MEKNSGELLRVVLSQIAEADTGHPAFNYDMKCFVHIPCTVIINFSTVCYFILPYILS